MKKKTIKIIIALVLFLISIIFKFENDFINKIIFFISYVIVGYDILKKAIRNIFRGKIFDENFLMSVATIGAFFVGEIPEAVAVMLFYQIGELFQDYAVDKSRKSISNLMNLRPDYANVLRDAKEEKIDPSEVIIGETIIIKPGEKVPLDGIVTDGKSMLDTKALTGESVPKTVREGEEILSGTINQSGLLKVKVTKEYGDSTVIKILELVENASSKKSKSENFITKFASVYTPIVVIIAIVLAILPPIILGDLDFSKWIYRALSFLVVSCPCALVISIPLSFFGGIGGASKKGILIKGSNHLEDLSNTGIVVLDKTGTLTEGVFEVQEIHSEKLPKEELLEIAAYSEIYSSHPIANSIKEFYGKELNKNKIDSIEEISGYGIIALFDNQKVFIGNEKLMTINNVKYTKCYKVGTVIYVAIDNIYAGYILISDKIKEDSYKLIENLKKIGIEKTVMLTGDQKEVANDVGEKLKIKEIYSNLLPNEKVDKVEKLLKEKNEKAKLIFVGDGINDSPVLAISDIGIAMGNVGSDSAIEAADIVIMTDEPSKIVTAINLSKKTMRIVKQNIIFAITIKILILILAALGISNMWWAVFADVGVSIIAILNALRMIL